MNSKYEMRIGEGQDAKHIFQLMSGIYERMENKSLFFCDDYEYVKSHIEKEGFSVVVYDGERLIGSLIVRFPNDAEDNLGNDIGLEREDFGRVAHIESVVVLENYRGQGLLLEMIRFAEQHMQDSQHDIFLATVSPDNPPSYKSFEKCGYEHMLTKEKYNGLMRRVYKKIKDIP